MEMANDSAFGRGSMPAPPLRPKAGGFVQSMVSGINRLEQRATGNRRKKFEAKQLPPGKDIFHGYEFPQAPTAATKTAGRKPYNWTPKRSRELIKLIIHTDLKFDDISTAMKDESGNGPSETTCRNHWHEIFGYSPDMARLKYGKGRERRLREHMDAFDAHRKKMKTLEALTVQAELQNSGARAARLSKVSSNMEQSRTSSIYADSGVQVDDEGANIKQSTGGSAELSPHNPNMPDFQVAPADPSEPFMSNAPPFQGFGLGPGLSTVQEDGEAPDRPTSRNPGPSEISPEDVHERTQEMGQDQSTPRVPGPKTVDQIEEKEGLPSGFIGWFRKISLGSQPNSRHPSTASYASRTSLRFSHSVRNSVATSISMGYHQERVPKDAICKYLGNNSALVEPSVGYVEELIQRGANVNAKNARGETPLHFAVGRGAIVICTILLQNGADAGAKSFSGETIWDFGRRVSKNTLNPNGTYDKTEQLLRTMVAARIEFLRATIKFNPDMIVEEPERAKRRRNSDQNAWSRSGAGGGRKKSKAVTPKLERSPSVAQPAPTPESSSSVASPPESTKISYESTSQPQEQSPWQYPVQAEQPSQEFSGQNPQASYFPDQTNLAPPETGYSMYDNHTQFTQPFTTEAVDPIYMEIPPGVLENMPMDPQDFDLATSSFQEDTATLHANQNIPYMADTYVHTNGHNYSQTTTGDLSNVQQQYGQPSPDHLNVQQYAQSNSGNCHHYAQSNPGDVHHYAQCNPGDVQHYAQSNSGDVQHYAQSNPGDHLHHNSVGSYSHSVASPEDVSNTQQYSQPSPPCPEGTLSPSLLSIGASPTHLSTSASPGQYFSDYPNHSERGNSNASSVALVSLPEQPTYTLGLDHSVQSAAACLPSDGQTYTGYPMATYAAQDHTWSAYQQDQNHTWGNTGGYSH